MKDILMITNADMSLQTGDVTLVLRRAEALYALYGIRTDCVVLNPRHMDKEIRHEVRGVSFRTAGTKEELVPYLSGGAYGAVLVYGELAQRYIPYIRRLAAGRVKILLDIQGALEEQIEYSGKRRYPVNYMKYLVKRAIFRRAAALSDGLLVVSDEMRDLCHRYAGRRGETLRFFKIRCGVSALVPEDRRRTWRREVRNGWGISDETVVMVFSGSRAPWQKTDEIIEFFKRCDRPGQDVFFAFFCSTDGAFSKKLEESFPRHNYTLEFLPFERLTEHLCGCDIGVLLRDRNVTNRVAFPNKFSDYLSAGLLVVMDGALPEPMRVLSGGGLRPVGVLDTPEDVLFAARRRQENLAEYWRQCDRLCREELLYEAQLKKSLLAGMLKK